MNNTYRFEFRVVATGLECGCYIDAPNPREAWALFEATHPPARCLVQRMSLFWDGTTNRRATARLFSSIH